MCLLLAAHDCLPDYRLILIANRDEFHARPTAPAAWWPQQNDILAGRDLESGGTWLGLHNSGRLATVTNVRSGSRLRQGPRSRGLIVTDFLLSEHTSSAFAEQIEDAARDYDGFNLLGYDGCDLVWYSNQALAARHLPAGIYTLSNAALDTAWPKTERLRAGFDRVMKTASRDPVPELLALLRDAVQAEDDELPESGVSREMERTLSPIFIEGDGYGTRCSSVVLVDRADGIRFVERRYDASGTVAGESVFEFALKSPARAQRGSHVSTGTRNLG